MHTTPITDTYPGHFKKKITPINQAKIMLGFTRYSSFDATNASKYLIDQSEKRILLIDQSKKASKQ